MATTTTEIVSASDIVAATSYGANQSPSIHVGSASIIGLDLKIDTAASVTGLAFTVQTLNTVSGSWHDLYRDNAGTFEVEEYTIPLSASDNDQLRSIRIAGDGIRHMRLNFKGVGGAVTINTIDAKFERQSIPVVDD